MSKPPRGDLARREHHREPSADPARAGVKLRHVGHDFQRQGIKDDNILPVLHRLRRPTLFTRDLRLYRRQLCHPNYCLVCLEVRERNAADFIRRFLRVPAFRTAASRMGIVVKVTSEGFHVWRRNRSHEELHTWPRR